MFNPPLDLGNDWEDVNVFSVEPNRFNYQHFYDLTFRADALLMNVTVDIPGAEYKYAGELFQYWEVAANRYQTRYGKVYLSQQNVIAIEPLATSRLLFRPATYLYNWTVDTKARRYEASNSQTEIDFTEVVTKLDLLREQFELSFDTIDANTVDAFNAATQQRLEILQQINQSDAGVFSLAEGLASLLPQEQGQRLLNNTRRRLDSDLGFL